MLRRRRKRRLLHLLLWTLGFRLTLYRGFLRDRYRNVSFWRLVSIGHQNMTGRQLLNLLLSLLTLTSFRLSSTKRIGLLTDPVEHLVHVGETCLPSPQGTILSVEDDLSGPGVQDTYRAVILLLLWRSNDRGGLILLSREKRLKLLDQVQRLLHL